MTTSSQEPEEREIPNHLYYLGTLIFSFSLMHVLKDIFRGGCQFAKASKTRPNRYPASEWYRT